MIFDTGGNTKENKAMIRKKKHHYLTLKPKKVGIYRAYIQIFDLELKNGNASHIEMNGRHYSCVKRKDGGEVSYIFFSPELYKEHMESRDREFKRQTEIIKSCALNEGKWMQRFQFGALRTTVRLDAKKRAIIFNQPHYRLGSPFYTKAAVILFSKKPSEIQSGCRF